MSQRLLSCGVFIDLKKAFDIVDHDILLDKLNHYGFRAIINDWFSSYLKNRTQTTQIGHHISNKANVECGVPFGSFLGPLLFLLYVNDIHRCSNKLRFYLFTDDTNISKNVVWYRYNETSKLHPAVCIWIWRELSLQYRFCRKGNQSRLLQFKATNGTIINPDIRGTQWPFSGKYLFGAL